MQPTKRRMHNLTAVTLMILLCSCSQPAGVEQSRTEDSSAPTVTRNRQSEVTDKINPSVITLEQSSRSQERKEGKSRRFLFASPKFAVPLSQTTHTTNAAGRALLPPTGIQYNTESYHNQAENRFILTANDPLSTFSIDVDTASYANVRRLLNQNVLPLPGSIRIEEMINYFNYAYPTDQQQEISISMEVGPSPWREHSKLVRIGLAAKDIPDESLPSSNLVFLVDISGSMAQPNKLPLLQKSMHMLVDSLGDNDRMAIVVYAGSDRIVLQSTTGSQKKILHHAIDNLIAGGSTHASSGITTAYQLARQYLIKGGNNRIILASDGDFNVGITSRDELEKLVARERDSGVFLTVLGFGMGNYHDDTMEVLADKGNGNYAYIDSLLEAKKVLVKERTANLFTLAKDVKLQIEFNPFKVGAYRLLGYENRQLADEDFKDDQKDAGEIGVGHRVTALYELLPPDAADLPQVDPLKYQKATTSNTSEELLTVKVRYKPEGKSAVRQISRSALDNSHTLVQTSDDFRFAAAVAAFGMALGKSTQLSNMTLDQIKDLAAGSRGKDENGYRAEFIRLVETAHLLQNYTAQK